jgi:transcriptional antiterminator RfaH
MKRWYAIYTQPRNEKLAADHLSRQDFEIFFPRYMKRRSHARKVDMVPAPLFPRYLFARFDSDEARWRAIRSTRGVVDLVRNGLDPVAVPDGIIDEIRARQDVDGFVVMARYYKLRKGAKIRIEAGPFAEYEAIFETQRDDERVIALLSLLGRKVLVDLPIRSVAPAT